MCKFYTNLFVQSDFPICTQNFVQTSTNIQILNATYNLFFAFDRKQTIADFLV